MRANSAPSPNDSLKSAYFFDVTSGGLSHDSSRIGNNTTRLDETCLVRAVRYSSFAKGPWAANRELRTTAVKSEAEIPGDKIMADQYLLFV